MDVERSAAECVAAAHEQTIAAASAHVEAFFDATWEMPPRTRRRQGGLLRPISSLASAAGRSLLRRVSRKLDFRHQSAEGVLDLQGRRYMLDRGGYACLGADGKEWGGPTGRPVPTCSADEPNWPTPLWLIDVLAGLTAATPRGTEDVRGTPCRRFDVIVDLSRASKFTPGAIAVPKVGRFEDLPRCPSRSGSTTSTCDESASRRMAAPTRLSCGTSGCRSRTLTGRSFTRSGRRSHPDAYLGNRNPRSRQDAPVAPRHSLTSCGGPSFDPAK